MNVLVLGAGQLARMMALAVKPLNIDIRAYDVGSQQVINPLATGQSFGDLDQGISWSDVITAEFEHIAHDVLAVCEQSGKLRPSSEAIKIGGDRRLEKAMLIASAAPNAPHRIIANRQDFDQALTNLPLPLILKSALAGYDGKGQWRIKSVAQADQTWLEIEQFFAGNDQQGIVAEQMISFSREVSLVGARNQAGEIVVYPLTENYHTDGILALSLAIDEPELQQQAKTIFQNITATLDYVGVLAIEFFQVGEQLMVNEIAPRVHNSGHWTQQGANVCQFANHIRAVCNLPLGNTELLRPTAMINIIGEDYLPNDLLALPGVAVHWYGKSKRAGRKMGHINVSAATEVDLGQQLRVIANLLPNESFMQVKQYINDKF